MKTNQMKRKLCLKRLYCVSGWKWVINWKGGLKSWTSTIHNNLPPQVFYHIPQVLVSILGIGSLSKGRLTSDKPRAAVQDSATFLTDDEPQEGWDNDLRRPHNVINKREQKRETLHVPNHMLLKQEMSQLQHHLKANMRCKLDVAVSDGTCRRLPVRTVSTSEAYFPRIEHAKPGACTTNYWSFLYL